MEDGSRTRFALSLSSWESPRWHLRSLLCVLKTWGNLLTVAGALWTGEEGPLKGRFLYPPLLGWYPSEVSPAQCRLLKALQWSMKSSFSRHPWRSVINLQQVDTKEKIFNSKFVKSKCMTSPFFFYLCILVERLQGCEGSGKSCCRYQWILRLRPKHGLFRLTFTKIQFQVKESQAQIVTPLSPSSSHSHSQGA